MIWEEILGNTGGGVGKGVWEGEVVSEGYFVGIWGFILLGNFGRWLEIV